MTDDEITSIIIGAAIEVHTELGPGLMESVYETCLFHELSKIGMDVERQKELPIFYKDEELDNGFRIDLLVQNRIIVEIKAVKEISDVHMAQALTYLKLGNYKVGLLINFNVSRIKYGTKRLINNHYK